MYAMLAGRPDFDDNLIKDDYIRGRSWNLVCDSDAVQTVSYFADTFLGAMNNALSVSTIAKICGSNNPTILDKQPRVEYIKQYEGDSTVLHPTFGTSLQEFSETYGVPLESPKKPTTTDFSKPPRATFAQAHLHRTKVVTAERATWAAVVYEAAFDKTEPKSNPFSRRNRRQQKKQTQPPSSTTPNTPSPTQPTTQPTVTPTDTPTDAPVEENPTPPPTAPPTSQYQLKVNAMEVAIAQMKESQASLDTTVKRLETNVEKISSSVEVIAKSQTDLQSKFEAFMETQNAAKQAQTAQITTLIDEAMHKHVYPQLNSLMTRTNSRLDSLETAAYGTDASQQPHTVNDNNHYGILDDDMDDTTTPPAVSGRKHDGSPSRSQFTPPPKRATNRTPPQSPAATPGNDSTSLLPTTQNYSGFTEQSQLSGGSE